MSPTSSQSLEHDPVPCVATVMARKGHGASVPGTIAALASFLPDADRDNLHWLDPGHVVDLGFNTLLDTLPDLRRRLVDRLGGALVDVVLQPLAQRRKKLFLADMDSTMIEQECIDELADFAGLKPEVAAITERAMRGEIEFEPALRARVALLRGLPVTIVDEVLRHRITLTPGGATLLRTLRHAGVYCALVSGGFTLFTGPIAQRLGFHEHRSNLLLTAGGALSGEVAEPILGRNAKLQRLLELRSERGLDAAATMAVGDGANDLAMIAEAGLGVAFHAKPAVAAAAAARIDHYDLEALLFIQGFARHAFVQDDAEATGLSLD